MGGLRQFIAAFARVFDICGLPHNFVRAIRPKQFAKKKSLLSGEVTGDVTDALAAEMPNTLDWGIRQ